jgi:sialate O-acetylesterase
MTDTKMTFRLAGIFTDHMVLQRDVPLPVWGWAKAGGTVEVSLAGHTAKAAVNATGSWLVTLPAMPAGGPFVLEARCGAESVRLRDVLIGEVWICSGQSNMQWAVRDIPIPTRAEEIAAAGHPQIRLFTVPVRAELTPQPDVTGAWKVCSPESMAEFSAVGYYFGRHLHRELGIPVGLINTSLGGTPCESWTSREALLSKPVLRPMIEIMDALLADPEIVEKYKADYEKSVKAAIPVDAGNTGFVKGWADPATDVREWPIMRLPQVWQKAGHNYSGVFWFRKEVMLPEEWAGKDLTLRIGPCDKCDITYFNNTRVGGLTMDERADAWETPRVYTIPGSLVRAGRNVIAVRVFSYMYVGGIHGEASQFSIAPAHASGRAPIALAGDWSYQVEQNFGLVQLPPMPPPPPMAGNGNTPTSLFNAMIAPLIPYGIRGAIWYQGESNADRGEEYRTLFPAMIADWRKRWGLGDFPFYFVQLANYDRASDGPEPGECPWAELREAQLMTLALPNTGMAVAIDIGDPVDIHPINKQDVGLRLALNALAKDYGQKDRVYSGPLYRGMKAEGGAIRLHFDHVDGGLVAKGGPLKAFAIAGADRKFVWAEAAIEGDTVVVRSPRVSAPRAVRYGWANDPDCHLYNAAGLPASPFRTDAWPVRYVAP